MTDRRGKAMVPPVADAAPACDTIGAVSRRTDWRCKATLPPGVGAALAGATIGAISPGIEVGRP